MSELAVRRDDAQPEEHCTRWQDGLDGSHEDKQGDDRVQRCESGAKFLQGSRRTGSLLLRDNVPVTDAAARAGPLSPSDGEVGGTCQWKGRARILGPLGPHHVPGCLRLTLRWATPILSACVRFVSLFCLCSRSRFPPPFASSHLTFKTITNPDSFSSRAATLLALLVHHASLTDSCSLTLFRPCRPTIASSPSSNTLYQNHSLALDWS